MQSKLVAWLGPDAQTIHAEAQGSRVILTGRVQSRSTRDLAEEVALSCDGVRSTANRIVAASDPDRFMARLENGWHDALLEIRVKRALQREGLSFARAIEVEAVDGIVSLRGLQPSKAAHDVAIQVTTAVDGVKRIIDLVRYEVPAAPRPAGSAPHPR